jgi:hypothetical protein
MSWFSNHYTCARCKKEWTDEWSCMCDDDCPHCGARHMSPDESEDLTDVVERQGRIFVALRSPRAAEHNADYQFMGIFATRAHAEEYLASVAADD